ncbi:MAG: DUF3866 family protein [Firmicutes bacterium]|nr:DUF3866 family protein [Bacillota bacterium]
MYTAAHGIVTGIVKDGPELQELEVIIEGRPGPDKAINYPGLYRRVEAGEKVLLNTVAIDLGLGTGGRHFVIPEGEQAPARPASAKTGHIMKLRYTPWQFPVLSVEEEASPCHQQMKDANSLRGVPVVIAPLHSMLPGIILGFRKSYGLRRPERAPKIAYVMTDGAALPLALSELVRELRQKQLLDLTITTGHAFGGDLEAVSIPAALLAGANASLPPLDSPPVDPARKERSIDLIIVALGPGIVGTGTPFGFSGIEQAWIIDLTARLGGIPIVAPRISEADPRERHLGISHHTLTILNLANHPAYLGISRLIGPETQARIAAKLAANSQLLARHHWFLVSDFPAGPAFAAYGLQVKTMGRGPAQDPAFFQSAIAAGVLADLAQADQLGQLGKYKIEETKP